MATESGTAGRYTVQHIPASGDSAGVENWRVTDADDNRVATCYYETHARVIADALNGARIVSEMLASGAARLTGEQIPAQAETRRENALESDPYATRDVTFADVVDVLYNLDDRMALAVVVNRRIFDDVRAAHKMLDTLGVASGPLTARIGLALLTDVSGQSLGPSAPISPFEEFARERARAERKAAIAANPVRGVDLDNVKIPEADGVLADLGALSGEEAFRVFDRVKVLPGNTAEARDWNLMEPDDVARMIAECCAVALNTGKLGELANAARMAVSRNGRVPK